QLWQWRDRHYCTVRCPPRPPGLGVHETHLPDDALRSLLIDNIGLLVTNEPEQPECTDAALVIDDGVVSWGGAAADAPATVKRVDAHGRGVVPGSDDSTSQVLLAGDRPDVAELRMRGEKSAAGGIRRTVRLPRAATDADLLAGASRLVAEMRAQGTT